jgi:hypothetical protein
LAIVGTNGADMAFAAGELRRMGGGQIVVRDGKVLAAFRMPILGLFSDQPHEEVLERLREIQAAAESLGAPSTIRCSSSSSATPAQNFHCCACRRRGCSEPTPRSIFPWSRERKSTAASHDAFGQAVPKLDCRRGLVVNQSSHGLHHGAH